MCITLLITATSCATSDEPYSVSVKNNLPQPVNLAVCDSPDCSKVADRWLIKPGHTGAVNVEIAGGYGPAIIFGPQHETIGCLPFRFSTRPQTEITVQVTDAVPCGSSGGVAAAHGKDWPLRADAQRVRETGRWLVRHGTDRCSVTVGLALPATGWAEEYTPLIQTMGLLSDQFGPLAACALVARR